MGKASVSGCPQSVHSPPSPEILKNFLYQGLLYLDEDEAIPPYPILRGFGAFWWNSEDFAALEKKQTHYLLSNFTCLFHVPLSEENKDKDACLNVFPPDFVVFLKIPIF